MTIAPSDARPELRFRCEVGADGREPSAQDGLYRSSEKNRFGESVVQIYATATGVLMRFPRVADFRLSPGEISCRLMDPDLGFMVDVCLLGHVMAYYLELSGVAAIHAGAVACGGRAVLFAADRTGGKSTLVASMVEAGFPLLADDIAALDPRDGAVTCRHAFPQLKLTDEQARRFAGSAEGFDRVHPSFAKLSVPADRVGGVVTGSLPVARLYLLERCALDGEAEHDAAVSVKPVAPGEALVQLVRHSFLAELLAGHADWRGLAGGGWCGPSGEGGGSLRTARFYRLAGIVRAVEVKRLCYPSGYQHLPDIHAAVLADLETLSPGET